MSDFKKRIPKPSSPLLFSDGGPNGERFDVGCLVFAHADIAQRSGEVPTRPRRARLSVPLGTPDLTPATFEDGAPFPCDHG